MSMNKVTIGFKESWNLNRAIEFFIEEDTHEIYVIDLADGCYEYLWGNNKITPYLYNPLVEIEIDLKREKSELRSAYKLAYALCGATGGKDHVAAVETNQAATLLSGAIIHECFTAAINGRVPSLSNVRRDLFEGDIYETLGTWLETHHIKRKTHESVRAIAREMLCFSPEVIDRIRCHALNPLNIWLDSELNYSKRTKTIGDILSSKEKPISLFIKLPYGSYEFYMPYLRAFYVQFIDAQKKYSRFYTELVCQIEFSSQIRRMTPNLSFEPCDSSSGHRVWREHWKWEAYIFPQAKAHSNTDEEIQKPDDDEVYDDYLLTNDDEDLRTEPEVDGLDEIKTDADEDEPEKSAEIDWDKELDKLDEMLKELN